MNFQLTFSLMLFCNIAAIAQPKDEFVFENGDDNVVFVQTLELGIEQAFVPAGLYFGWMLDNGLQSDLVLEVADYTLEEFNAKESTGPELFMTDWEGILTGELMNDAVYSFSKLYFGSGDYEKDLIEVLGLGTSSIYTIEDNWENYALIKTRLDERYAEYQAKRRGAR